MSSRVQRKVFESLKNRGSAAARALAQAQLESSLQGHSLQQADRLAAVDTLCFRALSMLAMLAVLVMGQALASHYILSGVESSVGVVAAIGQQSGFPGIIRARIDSLLVSCQNGSIACPLSGDFNTTKCCLAPDDTEDTPLKREPEAASWAMWHRNFGRGLLYNPTSKSVSRLAMDADAKKNAAHMASLVHNLSKSYSCMTRAPHCWTAHLLHRVVDETHVLDGMYTQLMGTIIDRAQGNITSGTRAVDTGGLALSAVVVAVGLLVLKPAVDAADLEVKRYFGAVKQNTEMRLHQLRRQAMLIETMHGILISHDLDALMVLILERARIMSNAMVCVLLSLSPDGERLESTDYAFAPGVHVQEDLDVKVSAKGNNFIAEALRTGAAVSVKVGEEPPEWTETLGLLSLKLVPVKFLVAMPLIEEELRVGVIVAINYSAVQEVSSDDDSDEGSEAPSAEVDPASDEANGETRGATERRGSVSERDPADGVEGDDKPALSSTGSPAGIGPSDGSPDWNQRLCATIPGLGAPTLEGGEGPDEFDANTILMLDLLCSNACIAIRKARWHRSTTRAREHLQGVLDSISSTVLTLDQGAQVTSVNRPADLVKYGLAKDTSGYTSLVEDPVGASSLLDQVHDEAQSASLESLRSLMGENNMSIVQQVSRVQQSGEPTRIPLADVTTLGGKKRMMSVTIAPISKRHDTSPDSSKKGRRLGSSMLGVKDHGVVVCLDDVTEREYAKVQLSRYLSPSVAKVVLDDTDETLLQGKQQQVTVLFADVRQFTSISEMYGSDVEGLLALMNAHFDRVVSEVEKLRGLVDKFIGDAAMITFGAPYPTNTDALRALVCALRLQDVTQAAKVALPGAPRLRLAIGGNTGTAICGAVGSNKRSQYTALGDAVNVAARMEGVCKTYGTDVLVTEDTRLAVLAGEHTTIDEEGVQVSLDDIVFRKLDQVRVVGRAEPVALFMVSWAANKNDKVWDAYTAALSVYMRADFKAARDMFRKIAVDDAPAARMAIRCEQYLETPPPAPWTGVYDMTSK